ncbi:MAG: hypothetical protein ACLP00_19505 [Terracidiphilus sp.]
MSVATSELRLADRIWLAVAMLQQQFPNAAFSKTEIRQELDKSELGKGTNPASVNAHLKQHLVANVPPSTGKYTMLFETRVGFLRLYRQGDLIDPQRRSGRGTKYMPKREEVPIQYHHLLDWYEEWCRQQGASSVADWEQDPLIQLIGSGKHIWADEHADEYVENLRREDL